MGTYQTFLVNIEKSDVEYGLILDEHGVTASLYEVGMLDGEVLGPFKHL